MARNALSLYNSLEKHFNFRDLSGKTYPRTPRFPEKSASFHEIIWKTFYKIVYEPCLDTFFVFISYGGAVVSFFFLLCQLFVKASLQTERHCMFYSSSIFQPFFSFFSHAYYIKFCFLI